MVQSAAVEEVGSTQEQIDTVYKAGADFTLPESKRVVFVRKARMKELGVILGFIGRVMAELGVQKGGVISVDLEDPLIILQLIAKLPDEVNTITACLCSLKVEEVEELDVADGAALITEIIEVNHNFFMKTVAPKIKALVVRAKSLF